MAKAHIFKKRNANRYRKIYNYIRKKPVDQFVSDSPFTMIVGEIGFNNESGPVTFTYTSVDPSISFNNAPVITAIAVDNFSNSQANVNIFVNSVSTTEAQFSSSAPFSGSVNFQLISRD